MGNSVSSAGEKGEAAGSTGGGWWSGGGRWGLWWSGDSAGVKTEGRWGGGLLRRNHQAKDGGRLFGARCQSSGRVRCGQPAEGEGAL